jgi:hypothetical protein
MKIEFNKIEPQKEEFILPAVYRYNLYPCLYVLLLHKEDGLGFDGICIDHSDIHFIGKFERAYWDIIESNWQPIHGTLTIEI